MQGDTAKKLMWDSLSYCITSSSLMTLVDATACYWLQSLEVIGPRLQSLWGACGNVSADEQDWDSDTDVTMYESSLIYMLNNSKLICKILTDCCRHQSVTSQRWRQFEECSGDFYVYLKGERSFEVITFWIIRIWSGCFVSWEKKVPSGEPVA